MKRIITRILCLCLFLLLLSPVIHVKAAELDFGLSFYEFIHAENRNDLCIYSTVLPENGTLSVSIDSQQISNPVLSTVRQEELPVTVYCLVDISTHMTKQQIQQQEDILNIISSRMGEKDSMVITTVGSKITEGVVLDTLESRKAAIDTLRRDGENADMYQAIAEAMTTLEQKTTFRTNRCLLILSDGILPVKTSTTEQQAMDAVSDTSIPVYAIGITGKSASAYSVEKAQHMLNMADASKNGIGIIPAKQSISAADAAQQIWEHIQESAVIKIDLAAVTSTSNSAIVRAAYTLSDSRLEDTITVDMTAVPSLSANDPTSETSLSDPEEQPEQKTITDWIKEHLMLVAGCACAIVILIAVLVVLQISSRKKKEKVRLEQKQMEALKNAAEAGNFVTQNASGVDTILSTGDLKNQGNGVSSQETAYPKTTPGQPSNAVVVQMTVTTHQDVSIRFALQPHKPQVLGRDDRADIIINAEDYQLSGKHCIVEWDGSYLYIQDMGSTNGTVLNGASLKPNSWNRLNNGSVVRMGSFEYQVLSCV